MDTMIKQTIDARKSSIYNTFEIDDRKIKEKIETLFKEIEELGKKCKDVGEFESEFSKSDLSKEYTDIFTYVATNFKPVGQEFNEHAELDNKKQVLLNTVDDEIKRGIKDSTLHARRKIRESVESEARGIPIIGDLMQAKNSFDLFKKFKKK